MLSIVSPVYDEADNIRSLLEKLAREISVPFELLIVYDYDQDNTLPVLSQIMSHYSFEIRLIKNKFGVGVLNAIKSGFIAAKCESVLVVMADLSDDLVVVDEMHRLILEEGYDIVCGSRYMPGGKQLGGPLFKKFLSRMAGLSLYYLRRFPTRDVTNSFKMYRRNLLDNLVIKSNGGFEIGMEIVVKAFISGKKITELPSVWRDRTAGTSRFRLWKWMPSYLRWYIYAFQPIRSK